jgi:hypothetical protein
MPSGTLLFGFGTSAPPLLMAKARTMPTLPTAPDLRKFIAST